MPPRAARAARPPPRPVAVVTGASSGIGRATAIRFGREGWRVAVCARTKSAIDVTARLVREAGGEALGVGADVGKWEDVRRFATAVGDAWGRTDVLVNNAGTGYEGPVEKFSVEDWNEQLATNLSGPFYCAKAFLPLLRKATGMRNVINVASVSGMTGHAGLSSYCATKFGLRGFTQAFAAEVADEGIRVVAVNPGYVATPMVDGTGPRGKKMIQPEDLADLIHYVATAPASIQLEDVVAWPQKMYSG